MICLSKSTAINVFPEPTYWSAEDSLTEEQGKDAAGQLRGNTCIKNGDCVLRLGPFEQLNLVFPRVQHPATQILLRDQMCDG